MFVGFFGFGPFFGFSLSSLVFRCFFDLFIYVFLVPCLLSSGLACGLSGLCRVAFVTVPTGFDPLGMVSVRGVRWCMIFMYFIFSVPAQGVRACVSRLRPPFCCLFPFPFSLSLRPFRGEASSIEYVCS